MDFSTGTVIEPPMPIASAPALVATAAVADDGYEGETAMRLLDAGVARRAVRGFELQVVGHGRGAIRSTLGVSAGTVDADRAAVKAQLAAWRAS